MLGVPLDLFPAAVHKGLEVTQAPVKECLELVPRDRDRSVCVMSLLVLLPAEANPVPEEGRGKRNLGRLHSSSDSKVVLALLPEVVAVYMGLPAVYVRGTGLRLFLGRLGNNGR